MAKEKPKNGRRSIKATRARPPGPQHKPTGKKDREGFVSPGFKSEGFQSGKKTPKTGPPPSVRAREEKRAKQPPPVKYAGKKKPPKKPGYPPWGGDVPDWPPKGGWPDPKGVPIYPKPKPKPGPRGVPTYPKPIKPPRDPGPNIVKPMKKKAKSKKARKK